MKQMQDFREWLSAVNPGSTPLQRRLAALTGLSRDRINSVASFDPWYVWSAETTNAS